MNYLPVLLFALAPIAAHADEQERADIYQAMLSCAAFHTIEATKVSEDTAPAQQAVAVDYAEAAIEFSGDGLKETVNRELESLLVDYREKLNAGEPRAMAEQWTALESACRELHPLKDGLIAKRRAELKTPAEPGR